MLKRDAQTRCGNWQLWLIAGAMSLALAGCTPEEGQRSPGSTSESPGAAAPVQKQDMATSTSAEAMADLQGMTGANIEMIQAVVDSTSTGTIPNLAGQVQGDFEPMLPRTGPEHRKAVQKVVDEARSAVKAYDVLDRKATMDSLQALLKELKAFKQQMNL